MKINIIGTGYVGLACCAFLAQHGNEIICSDSNAEKIAQLKSDSFECSEPFIFDIIRGSSNVSFSTEYQFEQDIYLVCVGTPNAGNIPDLSHIKSVISELKRCISSSSIIILKSTILPGTTQLFKKLLGLDNPVYFIPEFLSEGNCFKDYIEAEKIIIGTIDEQKENHLLAKFLSFHTCSEIHFSDYETAELTKYANNIMLASRIATMNQIALVADKVGANMKKIEHFVGLDSRIGSKYLKAGLGFGGSCLEKDLIALNYISPQDQETTLFSNIIKNNRYQAQYFAEKIIATLDKTFNHKTVVLTGLTFKNNSDDCRNSCAAYLLYYLMKAGYKIKLHDTILHRKGILDNFLPEFERLTSVSLNKKNNQFGSIAVEKEDLLIKSKILSGQLEIIEKINESLKDTHALIICQKHEPFELNYSYLKEYMSEPNLFDPNKHLDSEKAKRLGFYYFSIGH